MQTIPDRVRVRCNNALVQNKVCPCETQAQTQLITAVMCGRDHKHNLTVPSIDLACRESHIVIPNLIKTLDAKTVNYNGFQNLERTYRLPHNYVIPVPAVFIQGSE